MGRWFDGCLQMPQMQPSLELPGAKQDLRDLPSLLPKGNSGKV